MGSSLVMNPKKIPLDQASLFESLDYRDGKLFWKNKKSNLAHLNGKEAGTVHRTGYRIIKLGQKSYPIHRVIWVYHHGTIDDNLCVDHINGIKTDNRIENLRLVTLQQNCFNRSRLNAKGYTWNNSVNKWQASIWLNGNMKYLGCFDNEASARQAYLSQCKLHHQGI